VLAWDLNAYYRRLLLRQLPLPCTRVMDVGCGAGAFAAELADRVEHVDALDRSPAVIEAAMRVTPSNVTCVLADVLQEPLPAEEYDAIVSISALHPPAHLAPRPRQDLPDLPRRTGRRGRAGRHRAARPH
jgi:ubiquinone/menaquinone biosynthesis C-methylase UbiE